MSTLSPILNCPLAFWGAPQFPYPAAMEPEPCSNGAAAVEAGGTAESRTEASNKPVPAA